MPKIIMGPEGFLLDKEEYPVTFAALSAIKDYNESCDIANKLYEEEVRKVRAKRDAALSLALNKLKGSLT